MPVDHRERACEHATMLVLKQAELSSEAEIV